VSAPVRTYCIDMVNRGRGKHSRADQQARTCGEHKRHNPAEKRSRVPSPRPTHGGSDRSRLNVPRPQPSARPSGHAATQAPARTKLRRAGAREHGRPCSAVRNFSRPGGPRQLSPRRGSLGHALRPNKAYNNAYKPSQVGPCSTLRTRGAPKHSTPSQARLIAPHVAIQCVHRHPAKQALRLRVGVDAVREIRQDEERLCTHHETDIKPSDGSLSRVVLVWSGDCLAKITVVFQIK
jgi:hypothetical protein